MKLQLKQLRKTLLYAVGLTFVLGVGYSTFAQLTSDAYTVQTVHIFPSEISSNGWENVETLTFQNLDEYALFQDFNSINSATLGKIDTAADIVRDQINNHNDGAQQSGESGSARTASTAESGEGEQLPEVVVTDESASSTGGTEVDVPGESVSSEEETEEAIAEEDQEASDEPTPEELPQVGVEGDMENPESEEASPVEDAATTTVLRGVQNLFLLAVDTLTQTFSSTSATSTDVEDEEVVVVSAVSEPQEVESSEEVTFGFTSDIDVATTSQNETEGSVEEVVEAIPEEEQESVSSTTSEIADGAQASTTGEIIETELATTTDEETGSASVECEIDCEGYVLRVGNFGFPIEEGSELTGAQLRMSFAAKHRETRDLIPSFTMNYSFDGGDSWSTGGSIVIDDEVSNSINGGYYLFALPTITDPAKLGNLQVELRYDDDPELLSDLFVESVWLELFVLEPPENPVDPAFDELLAEDGFETSNLAGDILVVSETEEIEFTFTDDNTNETLIIKADQKTYEGLSEATTYFSVTNTSSEQDEFALQTHFPAGVGEVTDLQVFNVNKPREALIPEYRPYVYHCEAGWETTGVSLAATSSVQPSAELVATSSLATTTIATSTEQVPLVEEILEENTENLYSCRDTGVTRSCESIEGEGTACLVTEKVKDHTVTRYARGWDDVDAEDGEMDKGGLLNRAATFFGLAPERKDIPGSFEGRIFTDQQFTIDPGETVYFKMDIAFPAFSSGEYWIEAIGDSEYGLLDPFWSSGWQYRMPFQVENPTGTDQTEFQVRLQLDSSISDFWANIDSNGDDIRFVQEVQNGNLLSETGPLFDNAYDADWAGRVAITIDPSNINGLLTDFPIYVNLADLGPDFWAGVQSDGRDIRVTQADGSTELPYDLVEIDTVAETGELHFLAASIDSGVNTTFHIYYDNAGASAYSAGDTYGTNAVWAAYEAVYHFNDDPTTIGNTIADVSGNGKDLTVDIAALSTTTGQLGTAIDLTGSTGILRDSDWQLAAGDDHVSSGWYQQAVNSSEAVWQWGTGAQPERAEYMPWYSGGTVTGRGYFRFGDNPNAIWDRTPYVSQWVHFTTVTGNNIGDPHLLYEDNILRIDTVQDTTDPFNNDANGLQVGRYTTGGSYNGFIDELRFELDDSRRTAAWVNAEYVNQSTSTDFYATSTALTGGVPTIGWYDTSWNQRVPFEIAPFAVDGTQTDFPVYLDLSLLGPAFFTGVATDGSDIRITLGDGKTEVPLEVSVIDTGAGTGELYFKADISGGDEFYIYFDNEDSIAYDRDDVFGSENVWTNNFQAVYHLSENDAGIGNPNVYLDSTANRYHADDENASDGKVGLFGLGQEFGDTQADRISPPKEVLNGLTALTTSWWHQTTNTGQQTIVSGSKSNSEANEYIAWFSSDTNFQVYVDGAAESFGLAGTPIASHNTGDWNHFMSTADAAQVGIEVNFFVNGAGDTENPDPQPFTAIEIANGGLVIGQEQDSLGAGFQATQNFEGNLDEIRFANVARDPEWAATEYANMNDNVAFFSTSTAETLTVTEFVELDYWLQYFDYGDEEADVWVQIDDLPAAGTTIYAYYGNASAPAASDEMTTFSYDALTEVYYVVDDHGADSVEVTSLVDNNQVQLAGGTIAPLNRGESVSISVGVDGDAGLSILGPVSAIVAGAGSDGGDMLAPISFATTSFAIPTSRSVDQWFAYAPFGSTTVDIYEGASGTSLGTLTGLDGTAGTLNVDITDTAQGVDGDGAVVEATSPILLTHRHTSQGDGMVVYPPTTEDLYGINSNYMHVSALAAGSDPLASCSTGAGGTITGITRGDQEADASCTASGEGVGSAVRLSAQASPIAAIQQADGDGNESTVYWPEIEFGTQYALPRSGAYVAVVCSPRYGSVDLEMQDSLGGTIESATCTPGVTTPGKAYFTNGTGNGDGSNFSAGTSVVSTDDVPFYAVFEDVADDQDEKNIQAAIQARKYGGDNAVFSVGTQEEANAPVYEQLSFAWYQNAIDLTPTSTWPIGGGEFVGEGDVINGLGAIADGDVLRLRMNALVTNATATAGTEAFTLQYSSAASQQCDLVTSWFDIGQLGSTTAVFNGFNNPTIQDGTDLPSTLLASSTVAATYEERNFSDFNPTDIGVGAVGEWDWIIEANNIAVNTNYCFRMIRTITKQPFATYSLYPELETVGPPNVPTPISFFDNEKTTTLTPALEFVSIDIAGDDIHYEVQIDNDNDFSSVLVDQDSASNFLLFEEADGGSDKAPFASGETIRFNGTADLAASTTYWWRVRASDPLGSATSSDWSQPFSFTTDTVIAVSEWYQTTTEQFETNELSFISASAGSVTGGNGSVVGTAADFDDAVVGNAWGEAFWSDVETSGEIAVQVQFNNNGSWQPIPNSEIPGNNLGTTTSPINLLGLDTDEYNELRLVANFTGTGLSLDEWGIRWALRIETPVLGDLFDNQQTANTLPVFDFVSTDPQGDDIEYEISFSTDRTFETGSSTFNSGTDVGFENALTNSTTSPFTSANQIEYTTQPGDAFTDDVTYWWRARAKDVFPGGDVFSPWSEADAFTIDVGTTQSTWLQTADEQFDQGILVGTQATSGSVQISTEVGEYGTVDLTGNTWVQIPTERIYRNMVVIASSEFDFSFDDGDGRTARVRNKTSNSFEVKVDNHLNSLSGATTIDYIVMEAGEWDIDDGGAGVQLLAGTREDVAAKQVSTYSNAIGETIAFPSTFGTNPAAFVTISSNNDSDWVDAHVDGGTTRSTSVGPLSMRVALAIGNHTASVHAGTEDIDYIVVGTGTGTVDGDAFQSLNTGLGPRGFAGPQYQQALTGFSSTPVVTIVQNNSETGGQGGFAFKDLQGTNSNTSLALSVAEIGVNADGHIDEDVSVLAFESADGIISRVNDGTLTGEIAGEDIIFSDGAGPKFDNFSWTDNLNGSGVITYQMQYLVSENTYALIPDVELPGNSSGFTGSSIDLTSIDISVYDTIRPFAELACVAGDCPTIDEWLLEWSEGVDMSGTLQQYDRTTAVVSGSISASVNGGAVISGGVVAGDGSWTLPNVTAFAGDIVTVWVDGAAEANEAVGAFIYDGLGDITGVKLYEQHLSFDADETGGVITNKLLAGYDNSDDEDIMFSADFFTGNLDMCASGTCADANIYVAAGQTYIPATSSAAIVDTHDFINNGTIELDSNVFNVSGSWSNNATSSTDLSTVNMVAASGSETVTSTEDPLQFHNISFGGFGMATFTPSVGLDLSGDLTVATGTFVRGDNDITLGGSLATLFGGIWSGSATTTFDGSGAKTWSDENTVSQNVGNVTVDGPSTIVTVTSDVAAYDIVIGGNDTLVGGSGNLISVGGDWNNSGTFSAETSTVEIVNDDRVYPGIVPGSEDWYSDTDFNKRAAIVVDSDEVAGQLTDFPLYVDLSTLGDDFWTDVAVDGKDIRVTSGDGQTELPLDLVEINAVTKTGELHLLADSVSSTADTTFYLYFDNALAGTVASDATYGSEAVWSEYEAVYHFNDDPTAVTNVVADATGNGRNLQVIIEGLATTTGQLGLGFDFTTSAGVLTDGDFLWAAGDALVTSGWYFMSALDGEAFWEWGTNGDPNRIEFRPWYSGTSGLHYFGVTGGATYSINPRDTTNWHHFTTIGTPTIGEDNLVYEDSIEVERVTQTVSDPENTSVGLQVGRQNTTGDIDALFDEFRIATTVRNTDWIESEYINQYTPAIFYSTTSAETYLAPVTLDAATHNISGGGSAFYNLVLNDATITPAFVDPSVVVNCDFTVATGTVALPTGKLTVGCSFENNGVFMHNNGEVDFNGTGSNTIELNGTAFLNALNDVTFDGSGDWTFLDTNATSTGFINIDDGSVVFPSGALTIGATLDVSPSGASFDNNSGAVYFNSTESENVRASGSTFNDVVFGSGAFGWYAAEWSDRIAVTVDSAVPQETLANYPMYINLNNLGSEFWDAVAADGRDVRVTTANGETEVPHDVVEIDTGAQTGELHFLAPTISDMASTTFYVYVGNSEAVAYDTDAIYGAENVWVDYEAVYHFHEDPIGGATDVSGNGKDLTVSIGTPVATSGILGQALDTTSGSVRLVDSDWTWTAGENLISSGLYFMENTDNGALWQFGQGSGSNNGTYLAFMPNYDLTNRGRHFFGITSGGEYTVGGYDNTVWHHFTTIGRAGVGEINEIFEDNTLQDSTTQLLSSENPSNTELRIGAYQNTTYTNIQIDELRFATTASSIARIDYEYKNLRSAETLYSVQAEEFLSTITSFVLNEATTVVDGDIVLEGSRLVAPSETLFIGGSAVNTAGVYDPNSATTTFNSNDLGETFDFGDVSFFNLSFDGVGGGWTVGTTTVVNNLTLATGASYAQATNTTMTVGGVFSNQFAAAATDWTTSTLVLTGGDYTVTERLGSGDDYAIMQVSNDSDIVIWNSTISTSSILDNSSIYMPDFGGTDGQLNIYGDYERLTGAENWSYATDFDGTDLAGGGERQASVYLEGGTQITLATSTALNMVGISGATTTVQSLFGIYSLILNNATLNATRFSVVDTGPLGLQLRESSVVALLSGADFSVAPGRTGITVDASTINAQPSSGYTDVNFGTSSASTIYRPEWAEQVLLTVYASSTEQSLVDFPVYVDLSVLGPTFWAGVKTDGGDIRMTTDLGREIAIDMVEIDTVAQTGELHFLASSLSSAADTTFYIHYNNPSASAYALDAQYGANNVWGDYEAVYHFNENPADGYVDRTANNRNLTQAVGTAATTSGLLGTALDTTATNVMLTDADWAWTATDDLISSGLYFMGNNDTGALWEWGNCTTDDCMAFLPWYDNATRGYHRFGETSGNDYNFNRDNSVWHHFTTIGKAASGEINEFYEDDVLRDTYAQSISGENPSKVGLKIGRYTTGTYMDIDVDELRFSTVVPSDSWRKAEYNNLTSANGFYATSTGPTETFNITTDGAPAAFWAFSAGSGLIYGEAFDNDDGDPGSVQWDDSDYNITISGTVYDDDGVTPTGAPVCNGSTEVVTVVLDGSSTFSTPCDPNDGSYEITGIVYNGEPKITTYIESSAATGQVNAGVSGSITGTGTIAGNTITVSRPEVNDSTVLVAMIGKDDDPIISPPVGWTEISVYDDTTGDDLFTGAWYRVVTTASGEPATYDFTSADNGEGYGWWVGALVNVDLVTPIDAASTWVKHQNELVSEAASVTTVTNGSLALAAWFALRDNDLTLPDSSWSTQVEDLITPEGDNLSVVSKLIETAAPTGAVVANNVQETRESHAAQFVFRPAVAVSASSSMIAAAVTQTPIGSGASPFKTITVRDQKLAATTTLTGGTIYVEAPDMQDDDVLVAIVSKDDDFSVSAPAGWVKGADLGSLTGSQVYSSIWYKIIDSAAGEPQIYNFINNDTGTEEISYWVGSFENVDQTNVFDVTPVWSNVQNTSAPAAPSVTTVSDGAFVIAAWGIMLDDSVTMPGGDWVTFAEDVNISDRSLNVVGRRFATAGATGDVSVTGGSTDDVNVGQFALRPASAAVAEGIIDMDLYQNRVIVRHEDIDALTIADMNTMDSSQDTDLSFTVSTSTSPDSLTVLPGSGLYVWNSKEFAPDGVVTMQGTGDSAADGSLTLGTDAIYTSTSTNQITIGGSLFAGSGATFTGAQSLLSFTATGTGQQIGSTASSTLNIYDAEFIGIGGEWAVQTPIVVDQDIAATAGTILGIGDIEVVNGDFSGNGLVAMTGGTTQLNSDNTFGGTSSWQFNNLTLGDGSAGITTPAAGATTTVLDTLTITAGHFLDNGAMTLDLAGSGTVFVENGAFLEGTGTVRYSGLTPNILRTAYNNLVIDTESGLSVTASAPAIGLQVLGNLTVGALGTSTLDLNTTDPLTAVGENVYIGTLGSIEASDTSDLNVFGDWDNDGTFVANGGLVEFLQATGTVSVAAGNSPFADVFVGGNSDYTFVESATSTGYLTLGASSFVLQNGETLAVGGTFTNSMGAFDTTWTNTTLRLYSGTAYTVNSKLTGDTYNVIDVAAGTHPRFWNSDAATYSTEPGGSIYSMDHGEVVGDLNIYGDFVSSSYDDYWSYETDFDGAALGAPRVANVQIEDNGSVLYTGGSLTSLGSSTATTTISALGAGPYDLTLGGTSTVDMNYYSVREIVAGGLVLTGSPTITDISFGDFEVADAGGSAITVGGTVISVNPAQTYDNVRFATTTAINAFNVTATGTSLSAWRFVNVIGNLDGEAKDVDPGGDPGFVTWEDSAAIIDISGVVYQGDRATISTVCDGSTENVRLSIDGSNFATTTCAAGTGAYTFSNVSFGLGDTLTVYIDGETEQAASVTKDPISLISDMDLYENHVIVRHESGAPQTIEAMATYDSSDDADIPFTAVDAGSDTLTLSDGFALVVWTSKDFEPGGDVTVPGNGTGASYDGLVELFDNADYLADNGQTHAVGGSLLTGTGALIAPAESTFEFTATTTGRTIDLNEAIMFDATFSGSGDWTLSDPTFTASNDVAITGGDLTLPIGTTTIGGSFDNTAGAFDANGGLLYFTSGDAGNTVEFGGSDANTVLFSGIGTWSFADTNATSTDSFTVATGTVTLPSGTLTVEEDFIIIDTIAHNSGTLQMVGTTGGNLVTLNGNDLSNLTVIATGGDYTLTDSSAALLGSLTLADGTFTVGTGTVSIGGSFDVSGGIYNNGSGILLFNSTDGGEFIDPGSNDLSNVIIAGAGGWSLIGNATTTNNFAITNAGTLMVSPGVRVYVGNVFTNNVGGAATTWTDTILVLDGANEYETNVKVTTTEVYGTLELGENTDISMWNSSAATNTVPLTSSLYSQDNAGVDGDLYIYGDYHVGTTTEYWSAETDFDGVAVAERQANVYVASSSAVTLSGGVLEIVGTMVASTTIQNQGVGTFDLAATDGTLNADYYSITDLTANGLAISGNTSVTSLSNGFFTQVADDTSLITLVSGVINNNASLVITDTGFADAGFTGGVNVSLDATTTNSWSFAGSLGDLWGEAFDVDGVDDCSSIRWDDSSCLLTEQTNYRWRNDDGGEGAPDADWYDTDWSSRQRVRVINQDLSAYTNTAVKVTVDFDADMQSDFEDLRFTAADGATLVDHWIEAFNSGTDAIVWIEAPTLAADSVSEFFMYYGNVAATSTSDGAAVFELIEDFEDDNITEYDGGTGDIARFETDSTFAFGGGFGLDAADVNAKTTDGIIRDDISVSQGQTIRYMKYIDPVGGSGDESCTLFGVNGTVASNQNYAVCTSLFGTDRLAVVQDVANAESSGTILATSTADFTSAGAGWYEFFIDWETDDSIDVAVYAEQTGDLIATTTVTDSTYTTGGIGFSFWFENGGWDSYVAYPRTETIPTVYLGAEQSDGGATWANTQNTATGGFLTGETARLRLSIENSGLPIEDQQFQLEFAPKLTAPTCEAVSGGDFVEVPNIASCGVSAVCMANSANVTNGDPTTDHLVTAAGDFVEGEVVANPDNQSSFFDLGQNLYTELEYALQLTVNANNDAYCFRVTDNGSTLDSYSNLPELTLAFDPVLSGITLNDGVDISLTPGATTTIIASSTVTDFNGFTDLGSATTTFYKTSVGAACTPDNNNCYIATSSCSYVNCAGNSCSLICEAPFAYHTDPTDADGGEEWFAFMEVEDIGGATTFGTSFGLDVLTLRALDVQNALAYGTVDINENTGSFNPSVSLLNLGNEPLDVQVAGTDMTDGVTSVIPAAQQRYSTSTFDYDACIGCTTLAVTGADLEVDLDKPLVSSPAVTDEIYWGIEVPFGTASAPHTGINFFMAITD